MNWIPLLFLTGLAIALTLLGIALFVIGNMQGVAFMIIGWIMLLAMWYFGVKR